MVPTMVMMTTQTMTVMLAMMPIVRARMRIRTMMVPMTSTRNRNEDDDCDHLTMLHLVHGPDYASRPSLVPPRQHLGCARVEVTLGANRIGPGYAGFCAGNAGVTPKVTPLLHEGRALFVPRLHPDHPRVTPGRHPVTPWSLPGRTPVTPNLCSDHARDIACHGQVALGPHLHRNRGRQSYTEVTAKLSPSHTKLHPGYTRLHRGNAKVTHRIRPGGTPVTPWIYLGHTPGYTPVALG